MPSIFDADEIEVLPEEAAKALADASAQLVDVRQPYEWDAGRIEGAIHIPLERLASRGPTQIDKDRRVIFQCRLGARSALATHAFRAAGYDAYSMVGGIARWADEGRPLVPEGATVADH
jgi:rhodanese-related sulfurtransferase